MEEADKNWMIRMVGGSMCLLILAHPGSPGQRAVKRLLWLCCCDRTLTVISLNSY